VAVLLIACSAVVSGARSFTAIDEWAADAPQDVLARLGARTATALAMGIPPSGATIRRVIKDTCSGGLADLLGHDPAGTDTPAVDGKSARGSRLGATPAAHLLAAMTGTGMTVTQLRVPEKTNAITCFAALLDPYDLQGVTVNGDALHTQCDHARFLVEVKQAHYAFTVKRNQKNLYEQLRTLPWQEATAKFCDRAQGHGRKETRVVQVLTVTGLGVDFPHAAQVAKVVRHRTDTKTGKEPRDMNDTPRETPRNDSENHPYETEHHSGTTPRELRVSPRPGRHRATVPSIPAHRHVPTTAGWLRPKQCPTWPGRGDNELTLRPLVTSMDRP
jgi:predicted transposase YbfD/YdcC